MIEIQVIPFRGVELAGSTDCPKCSDSITLADGRYVAIRLPDRMPLAFHIDCYMEFTSGLVEFCRSVLPHCTPELVH